jgi:predicted PP-loop superfamily ATPase
MVFNIDTNVLIAIAGGITSIAAAIVVVKKSVTNITKKVKSNIKQEMEEELKKNVIEPMYNKALETYNNDLAALK